MSKMRYLQKEIVCVLCLDTKGQVTTTGTAGELASDLKWGKMLSESTVFEGTLNSTVFHPREIFRFAIEASANSIVLVHNHPSGDPQPSQEDVRATKQLIEAGNHIGIKVLDHVVIGDFRDICQSQGRRFHIVRTGRGDSPRVYENQDVLIVIWRSVK